MHCALLLFLLAQCSAYWVLIAELAGITVHHKYHFKHSFQQGPVPLRVASDVPDPASFYRLSKQRWKRPTLLQYLDVTGLEIIPYDCLYEAVSQLFPFEASGLMSEIIQTLKQALRPVNPSFLPVDFRVCQPEPPTVSAEKHIFIAVGLVKVYELLHMRIGPDGKPLPEFAEAPLFERYSWSAFKLKYPRCYYATNFPGFPSLGKLRSEWLYRLNFKTLADSVDTSTRLSMPAGLVSPSPLAAALCPAAAPGPLADSPLTHLLYRVASELGGWEYRVGDLVILGVGDTPLLRVKWVPLDAKGYHDALVYSIAEQLGYGSFYCRSIQFPVPSPVIHLYPEAVPGGTGLLSEYVSLFPPSIPTPVSQLQPDCPVPPKALAFAYILARSSYGNTWNALAHVMGLLPAERLYCSCGTQTISRTNKFYGSDRYNALPSVDELDLVTDYYRRIPRAAWEALLVSGSLLRGCDSHDGNFVLTYSMASDTFTLVNIDYDAYLCNYYPGPMLTVSLTSNYIYTIPMHPHAHQGLQDTSATLARLKRVNASAVVELARGYIRAQTYALCSISSEQAALSSDAAKLLFIVNEFPHFLEAAIALLEPHNTSSMAEPSLLELDVALCRALKINNTAILDNALSPAWRWSLLLCISFAYAFLLSSICSRAAVLFEASVMRAVVLRRHIYRRVAFMADRFAHWCGFLCQFYRRAAAILTDILDYPIIRQRNRQSDKEIDKKEH